MSGKRGPKRKGWRYSTLDYATLEKLNEYESGKLTGLSWLQTARERGWTRRKDSETWALTRVGDRELRLWRRLTGRASAE